MTTIENLASEVEDPGEGSSLSPGGGAGLVLPEEVLADLAGQLAARTRAGEPAVLTGPGGLLTGLIGQVLQAGLAAELGAHLEAGDGENRRNGSTVKTLNTEAGPVRLAVPRDRDGSFEPLLVPAYELTCRAGYGLACRGGRAARWCSWLEGWANQSYAYLLSAIGDPGSNRNRAWSGLVASAWAIWCQLWPLARALCTSSGRQRSAWSMRLAIRVMAVRSSPSQRCRMQPEVSPWVRGPVS